MYLLITDLRRRAEYGEFGALKDSLIRDQIVVGINDPKLRERLLRETDLSLEKAIKLCRITEQSKEQSKVFDTQTAQTSNIGTVKKISPIVKPEKTEDWRKIVKCKFVDRLTIEETARPMESRATNVKGEIIMHVVARN